MLHNQKEHTLSGRVDVSTKFTPIVKHTTSAPDLTCLIHCDNIVSLLNANIPRRLMSLQTTFHTIASVETQCSFM